MKLKKPNNMPTGYTAPILDGKITTFPEFAKLCMRAFGVTIHMREEGLGSEYTPIVPSDYHLKEFQKASTNLIEAKGMTDEEIISQRKKQLEKSKGYHLEQIENKRISLARLNFIIIEAKNYQPPTADHEEIKRFMIRQLNSEIGYMSDYSEKELVKIEQELTGIDANKIRLENIEKAKQNIEYHTREYSREIEGCDKSNKWVSDFINSLNVNK